jgi:hypothetical protein
MKMLKIAALIVFFCAVLALAYAVKSWSCEGSPHRTRCMLTR